MKKLKLFLLVDPKAKGFDVYDKVVVCAEDEANAKLIHPNEMCGWNHNQYDWPATPDEVEVTLLGNAAKDVKKGVVLASYKAG